VSFLSFANPENGDAKLGITALLPCFAMPLDVISW
jgi:hypothetical protein